MSQRTTVVVLAFFPLGYSLNDTVRMMANGFHQAGCDTIWVDRHLGPRQSFRVMLRGGGATYPGTCVRPRHSKLPYRVYSALNGPEQTARVLRTLLLNREAAGQVLLYRSTSAPNPRELSALLAEIRPLVHRQLVDVLDTGLPPPLAEGLPTTVLAVSPLVAATLKPPVAVHPNGVDSRWLGLCQGPRRTPSVAAFVGNLALLDVPWVVSCAQAFPGWEIRLIGPLELASDALRALRRVPNIHLLGPVPYDRLPGLCQDVTIWWLFLRDTPQVQAADPLTLYEALATGAPVVSPPFAWATSSGFVLVARDASEAVALSNRAVSHWTTEQGTQAVAAMAKRTWAARAEAALATLNGW